MKPVTLRYLDMPIRVSPANILVAGCSLITGWTCKVALYCEFPLWEGSDKFKEAAAVALYKLSATAKVEASKETPDMVPWEFNATKSLFGVGVTPTEILVSLSEPKVVSPTA